MLGAILGDIIGSAYEFHNTKDYQFKLFTSQSNYTDDSIMTLAVADWAMHDPNHTHALLEKVLVSYAIDFPCPMGGYGGGFSTWLFHPEHLTTYGNTSSATGRHPYNSWGNGSAMRVSSIGWLFDTLDETERIAALSASITHNHPEGIKGAQATAAAVFLARTGATKDHISRYITQRFGYDLSTPWAELQRTYTWQSSCQGTVPPAIIAFLHSTDFEDAIRRAISMGGDSDTIGAITGAIAEAYYRDIPMRLVIRAMHLLPPRLLHVLQQFRSSHYTACFDRYIAPYLHHRSYTPGRITSLRSHEIFVFGSNLAGRHGGGAARLAYEHFGAEWGVGVGLTGQTYAIPTMQGGVETIRPYTDRFIQFATDHPELKFFVTKIGCGIAGFREEEIAPLFLDALAVENIILPRSFVDIIFRHHLNVEPESIPLYKVNWFKEAATDLPLTQTEYDALCRSFAPDWDFRYKPVRIGDWHYFIRSGRWVKKFRYDRGADGLYHLCESYTADIEMGRNLLAESFTDGYYRPSIHARPDSRSGLTPLSVAVSPVFCHRCGHPVSTILYGEPSGPVNDPHTLLGGCVFGPDSPDFECPHCHQQYVVQ